MKRGWMLVVVLWGQGIGMKAASFDCRKAVQPQEKAICADASLGALDEQMAAAYRSAQQKVSAASATAIRADQRMWLRWLGTVCGVATATDIQKLSACMKEPYGDRVGSLKTLVEQRKEGVFFTRIVSLAKPDEPNTFEGGASFPGIGVLTATWPQADSTDPKWVGWNAAVERWVRSMSGEGAGPWTPDLALGGDQDVTASIEQVTEKLVGVHVENNGMGHGAAHPFEVGANFYWLLQERRPLRAEDVFRAGTPWQSVLARRCWTTLQHDDVAPDLFIKGAGDKDLLHVAGSTKNWSFGAQGLTISFPEYSISPRVAPAPDVLVPWAVLQPYLAATSPVGR